MPAKPRKLPRGFLPRVRRRKRPAVPGEDEMLRLRSVYRPHPAQAEWLDQLASRFPKRAGRPDPGSAVSYVLAQFFADMGIVPTSTLPLPEGRDAEPQVFEDSQRDANDSIEC